MPGEPLARLDEFLLAHGMKEYQKNGNARFGFRHEATKPGDKHGAFWAECVAKDTGRWRAVWHHRGNSAWSS